MAKLKVPSLQHLARNWKETSEQVHKSLVNLARHPPQFSYEPLFSVAHNMLAFSPPYEQVAEGIRRADKRVWVRETLLEVLPLLQSHFDCIIPDFPPRKVARRFYPLARDIMIPFEAPIEYSVSGQVYFPWFSFWRSNPLTDERLSLFVTLVEEVLLQDPDLDTATFQILDFSKPRGEAKRRLLIMDADEIPRLNNSRKKAMLQVFADGYRKARDELVTGKPNMKHRQEKNPVDPMQPELFGSDAEV